MTDMLESAPRQSNPPTSDKLVGRVAFVTGGTRGMGQRNRDHGQHNHARPDRTEMTADIPVKVMSKLTSQIPVGRAGRPKRSRGSFTSSPPTRRRTSPGRCGASTAEWTCEPLDREADVDPYATQE